MAERRENTMLFSLPGYIVKTYGAYDGHDFNEYKTHGNVLRCC